jgi:hypothetical protein
MIGRSAGRFLVFVRDPLTRRRVNRRGCAKSFTILLLSPEAGPSWPEKIRQAIPGAVVKAFADPQDALASIKITYAACSCLCIVRRD